MARGLAEGARNDLSYARNARGHVLSTAPPAQSSPGRERYRFTRRHSSASASWAAARQSAAV